MRVNYKRRRKIKSVFLFVLLFIIALLFIAPVIIVIMNSFKTNTGIGVSLFSIPNGEFFAGFNNYLEGLTFGNYPFLKAFYNSVVITITSTILILLTTSMAAWYISRVGSKFTKIIYKLPNSFFYYVYRAICNIRTQFKIGNIKAFLF